MKRQNLTKAQLKRLRGPSKIESIITMILGFAISIGLWRMIPAQFTQTEGPAGIIPLIAVFILGILLSVTLVHIVMQRFSNNDNE